jgi:hypothetical protein
VVGGRKRRRAGEGERAHERAREGARQRGREREAERQRERRGLWWIPTPGIQPGIGRIRSWGWKEEEGGRQSAGRQSGREARGRAPG